MKDLIDFSEGVTECRNEALAHEWKMEMVNLIWEQPKQQRWCWGCG